MKTEITQIFYLPHCNSCDGEAYHCDNCHKHFELNPNTEQAKHDIICIHYQKSKGKNWINRGHACSDKCAKELIEKYKINYEYTEIDTIKWAMKNEYN